MKKTMSFITAIVCAFATVGCSSSVEPDDLGGNIDGGSEHVHEYTFVKAKSPTCTENGYSLYYSCDCGKIFKKSGNEYVETTMEAVTLPKRNHEFGKESVSEEYFIAEATETTPQLYAKSCFACGAKSENDTFTYGKTLAEYRLEDKSLYSPVCFTMTLYDAANCVYGFTWDEKTEPARPVLKIAKKTGGEEQYIRAGFSSAASASPDDKEITYYSCKVSIELEPETEYVYSVGDKYLDVYTAETEIKTVNPEESGAWKFVHASDSQAAGTVSDGGVGTDVSFGKVLNAVSEIPDVRFMVHTGDVVEWSKYQSYWENMLDGNFAYLSKLPVMAISGNHETTYRNGTNETYNRFNYKIPKQNTNLGFYYSYSYGDVKFIMLNTNNLTSDKLTSDQSSWLKSELKNKTEKWTIVAMHNPMYSVGKWGSDPDKNTISLALASQLKGLFAECKVDVVLQGHDHMVSRTHLLNGNGKATEEKTETIGGIEYIKDPDGVIYVMNGPAGDQARTEVYDHDESLFAYADTSKASSWAEFTVYGDRLSVQVKTANTGSVTLLHEWGIKKSA